MTRLTDTERMPRGLPRPISKGLPVPYEALLVEEDGQVVVLKQSDATRTQAFVELQDWIKRNAGRR